jgi:hypothetical protein
MNMAQDPSHGRTRRTGRAIRRVSQKVTPEEKARINQELNNARRKAKAMITIDPTDQELRFLKNMARAHGGTVEDEVLLAIQCYRDANPEVWSQ